MKEVEYLIIGNSAGGIGAAEAIRQLDSIGATAIVSDEPYPAYSRVRISELLARQCPPEEILFRPSDFYEKNDIWPVLGKKAERLDAEKHTIQLDDGTLIKWRRLLLACGGSPIIPPIKGIDSNGVFSFTTLDDALAINNFLNGIEAAVVIGGGLIGVSATEALVKRGIGVTIVEMQPRILSTILDEEASALEAAAIKQAGIEILTDCTATEINNDGKCVTGVALNDGRVIPCGLVIVAIGVMPRTELAAGSGTEVNRGIVVDEHMATSQPDIYACGDAAEVYDFAYGQRRLTPIWPNAYQGGRVAGLNMAGVPTRYQGSTSINTMKYFGVDIVSAGITVPPDDSYRILSYQQDNIYRKVVIKDNCVAGMVFAGDIEKSGIVLNLMREKVDVSCFDQALVGDDFGLACLPDELWRSKLTLPAEIEVGVKP